MRLELGRWENPGDLFFWTAETRDGSLASASGGMLDIGANAMSSGATRGAAMVIEAKRLASPATAKLASLPRRKPVDFDH